MFCLTLELKILHFPFNMRKEQGALVDYYKLILFDVIHKQTRLKLFFNNNDIQKYIDTLIYLRPSHKYKTLMLSIYIVYLKGAYWIMQYF